MFDFLSQKLSTIFSSFGNNKILTESSIEQTLVSVHDALLEADVPYEIVQKFIADIKQDITGQKMLKALKPAEQIMKVVHDRLLNFLGGKSIDAQSHHCPDHLRWERVASPRCMTEDEVLLKLANVL